MLHVRARICDAVRKSVFASSKAVTPYADKPEEGEVRTS